MTWITELQDAASHAAEVGGGAVVRVGRGSGVVVADGTVLTNAHNLHDAPVGVVFADGRREQGAVAGVDVDGDLAVVSVDTGDVSPAAWSETAPDLGTPVFTAVPRRGGGTRVTFGTVSSTDQAFRGPRGRLIRDAVEHTAPLARGSSGSPILDAEGRVVGINTHRRGGGFYLALPTTDELRRRLDALTRGETPRRPRLGIAVAPGHVARRLRAAVGLDDRPGLLVRDVEDDSPAGRAGIRGGDLLVRADGTPIEHSDDLFALLDGLDAEATLTLVVVRGSEEREVAVTFGTTREEGSA